MNFIGTGRRLAQGDIGALDLAGKTVMAVAAKFLGDKVPTDASKVVIEAKLEEIAKSE